MDYRERLLIPEQGDSHTKFYTKSGTPIAEGYERIVIGERGPYVEFTDQQVMGENLDVPENQIWRFHNDKCYYHEFRSKDESFVKVYHQKKIVNYADYKVGLLYISPFDLISDVYPKLIGE